MCVHCMYIILTSIFFQGLQDSGASVCVCALYVYIILTSILVQGLQDSGGGGAVGQIWGTKRVYSMYACVCVCIVCT